jgi:hypothetical protein
MKKIVFALIFLVSIGLKAQLTIKAGVVKSNVILKDINIDNLYESKFDPLFAGVHYRLAPLNLLGFETGIQYTGIVEEAVGTQIDIENHYLSIPVSVNIKPSSIISPGVGVLFSSLVDSSISDIVDQKSLDVSAFLKVNINPFKKLGLELGYNLGLVPFVEWQNFNQNGVNINNGGVQNRYFYGAVVLKI